MVQGYISGLVFHAEWS